MKKFLTEYYAVIMLILFITYNIVLDNLKIIGLLYYIGMIIIIVINAGILFKYKNEIKLKNIVIVSYFLLWLNSKNMFQCSFALSTMGILMCLGFKESKSGKVISIIITSIFAIFFYPILFISLLIIGIGTDEHGLKDIYEDMHYYCENHYEAYSYSGGAFDSFHYSINKHYEIVKVDGIIEIIYSDRNDTTEREYKKYIKKHNCKLVGDKNESK